LSEEILVVLSTFPDVETARRISRQLVEEHCSACANILAPIESVYCWEGKVENANEALVLFKTSADRYGSLETKLRQLHPYEVPEIIALPIERGLTDYLRWVCENCADKNPGR
jgi:periplasmic divalent cation tolerance protein